MDTFKKVIIGKLPISYDKEKYEEWVGILVTNRIKPKNNPKKLSGEKL